MEVNQGDQPNSVGIRWIKVDDRILIDGPSNTSQVFSEGWDANTRSPKNSFNGNVSDIYNSSGVIYDLRPATATWTGSVPIDGPVELNLTCGGTSITGISVKVNDIEIGDQVPLFETFNWITVPGLTSGNLTKIELFAPSDKDPSLRL